MILSHAVRALIRTVILAGMIFNSLPAFALTELSYHADETSKSEFLDTYFFSNSRGMHQYPGVIDFFETIFAASSWSSAEPAKSFLFQAIRNRAPEDVGVQVVDGKFVGVYKTTEAGYHMGVAGCVLCHSGKAAGIFIPGLGNKNVNLKEFAEVGLRIPERAGDLILPAEKSVSLQTEIDGADRMLGILSDSRYFSPTDGLIENNIVLRTFFESFGRSSSPGTADQPKHFLNKIPHLWGIEAKRPAGLFVDGGGDGDALGWAVAPEIMWGQTSEEISKPEYVAKILHEEQLMNSFLPPAYPFQTQSSLVNQGAKVFSANCMKCHGSYGRGANGLPVYQAPKLVPLTIVQTDATRSDFFRTPGFWEAAQASSFQELIKKGPQFDDSKPEYFAPRLDGIWARFPYLHNGSVPTLWHLLHPEKRPDFFSVENAGEAERFDREKNGLTTSTPGSVKYWELAQLARLGNRKVYWTGREGQSSKGHVSGAQLPETDKDALIEYLKTL